MPAKITPEECKNLCKDCTTCCDYATIKIPQTKDDIDEIRWLLLHKITIFTEYNKCWYIKIYNKCIASTKIALYYLLDYMRYVEITPITPVNDIKTVNM